MRSFIATLTAALLLCLLAGCKKSEPPPRADLQPRLEAALQINNMTDRDSALKAVAADAASAGAGDITKHALGAMNNLSDHDDAASDCASRLAKAKQISTAKEVAETINSMSLRDSTLKKLAEGL